MSVESIILQMGAFVLAPFLLGIINRTKAIVGGRTGQPFLQAYFDLWKLLQKGAVYSVTTTWIFRAGPIVGLAAAAAALLLVPMAHANAAISFGADLVLLAGILGLMRFFTMIAALDTGSAFEGMGASREAILASMAEPAFFLALAAIALVSGSFSLTTMLGGLLAEGWTGAAAPALVLAVAAIFLVMLAENARIPIDDPNTHLELTMIHEVMVLDHSGPDLAYILYGSAIKLWLFAALLVAVVIPFHTGSTLADVGVFLGGMAVVAVVIGLVESSMARLRMFQTSHLLISASVLGALAVALALGVE